MPQMFYESEMIMVATEQRSRRYTIPTMPEQGRGRDARLLILQALDARQRADDVPPTVREMATATGLDRGSVEYHLEQMVARRWVKHTPGAGRSWRLTPLGRQQLG